MTRLLKTPIIGRSADPVASSCNDMLAGLSKNEILRTPPDFCAKAGPVRANTVSSAHVLAQPRTFRFIVVPPAWRQYPPVVCGGKSGPAPAAYETKARSLQAAHGPGPSPEQIRGGAIGITIPCRSKSGIPPCPPCGRAAAGSDRPKASAVQGCRAGLPGSGSALPAARCWEVLAYKYRPRPAAFPSANTP